MEIKLYNTLNKKIEKFKPIKPGFVGMYTCGITAYDHTHLGHMRTYVNTDCLRRMLEYNGLEIKQVENVTDVGHLLGDRDLGEDKLEIGAKREGKSAWEIAKIYEKEFFQTMEALNVKKPTVVCRATEHIKEMIELIKKIEKKGYTYRTSDGIYFDSSKIKDYNRLSGMPLEKLKKGARVEVNPEKKSPLDFALWKFSPKTGPRRQMEWDSPWGVGFPGWHIECSAMGMKYLGEHFDIHTGGVDHIPIHHSNEIAQNEAATGHQVVNFWIHNEFLLVEGKKMSKSLGNFYILADIQKRGFAPQALRYLFLTAHYRAKMNFTWRSLEGAQAALGKLKEVIANFPARIATRSVAGGSSRPSTSSKQVNRRLKSASTKKKENHWRQKFLAAINNDLNMPEALAVVWEVVKSNIPPYDKLELLLDFDQVLGLGFRLAAQTKVRREVPKEVEELVEKREKLRKQEKWAEADKIRKQVEKFGWKIEDTPGGPKLGKQCAKKPYLS